MLWKAQISFVLSLLFICTMTCTNVMAEPHDHEPIVYCDIIIDAGHGGVDSGTSHNELLEKQINLDIAQKLYQQLNKRHYEVILNRTGDYALSDDNHWLNSRSRHRKDLAQRKELSEQVPSRILISLHVNWSKKPSVSGPLVLFQRKSPSYFLARQIQTSLNDYYGTPDHLPRVGRTYYLLNQTHIPAVIVEMGFISNPDDRRRLTSKKGQEQIARHIAAAVEDYFLLFKE